MPAQFIIFLVIAQLIIIIGHYVVYKAVILLFAVKSIQTIWLLRYCIALLSLSFLSTTIYTRTSNNAFGRMLYRIAASWMGFFVYFFLASIIILLMYSVRLWLSIPFNWEPYSYAVAAISIILPIYGLIGAQMLQIKKISVSLKNLPRQWKGKSFVFISDTHLGHVRNTGFAKKIVDAIDSLKPEFVLHGGDFFDGVDMDFKSVTDIFGTIKTKHGIFFATGNHESFEDDDSKFTNPLKSSGIRVLNNEKVDIDGLTVIGAEYSKTEKEEDFVDFMNSLHAQALEPSILIKHVPSFVDKAKDANISLMLSGHTHLGQLWPFRYITHRLFKNFDYGLKSAGDTQVYTSSGAGTWGPPMRVFTPSEIVYITLN